MNLIENVNKKLAEINENLFISLDNEDYSEQDMEEYGIQDINDTARLTLQLRKGSTYSVILKENFLFNNKDSLFLTKRDKINLEVNFTNEDVYKIENILLSNYRA